ncbi:MAG: heme-binding domain-containing protein [Panacibacter sp.]
MKRTKKLLLVLLVLFIVVQFIQPARNTNGQVVPTDITKLYALPNNVQGLLKTSCYDCHSNNTNYPWYSHIQPGAWLMAYDIKTGKAMLNFSQFGKLSNRRQQSKLQGIINQVEDDEMPISSYTLIHRNAVLTPAQKTMLINWAASIKDSLSANN